jgi:serine/threonine-protein kinase HipA
MARKEQRCIEVWADWKTLGSPVLMGHLYVTPGRGKEVFSFEYDRAWIESPHAQTLDPSLSLYPGPQYAPIEQNNFGIFLDSAPDRWGRVLMDRREAQLAREEKRTERKLQETDYLLGVYDGHRQGALRFREDPKGSFLDDNKEFASPPWTSLRELEHASACLGKDNAEEDPCYSQWLKILIAPGGSLGGARPKASVRDAKDQLWIAKFPSNRDRIDVGAWEYVVHKLARRSGLITAEAKIDTFASKQHTFLTKRFDRTNDGKRLHFASALTLLQRKDGDDADSGASYLELVELLSQRGAQTETDLLQLWTRIVFFICVSNVDDHLRNHGFMLEPTGGWVLAPAYDINPDSSGNGLKLNISETDNAQDLSLAKDVARYFRVKKKEEDEIIGRVTTAVKNWRKEASGLGISEREQSLMANAFRVAEQY